MQPFTDATRQYFQHIYLNPKDELLVDLNDDGTRFVCDIGQPSPFYPDKLQPPSQGAGQTFVCRIPERKHLKEYLCRWEFATTDFTAAMIKHHWPHNQVFFQAEARIVFDYLVASSASHDVNVKNVAHYKAAKTVPEHSFELHPVHTLAGFQQVGLVCASRSEGYALFMEMGTGKTPIVIARICNESKRVNGRLYKSIIVCPKNVRMQWQDEIEKFATTPGKVTVLRGTEIQRTKQLIEAFAKDPTLKFTVIICSYKSLCVTWNQLKMVQWDLATLDESHNIKSPTAARYKIAMDLRDRSDKRMILTGTPIANSWLDLFAQFEFLGKGFSGFNNYKNFRAFYGRWKPIEAGHSVLVETKNLPFMQERLARLSFIIRKDEALPDLPDMVYDIREVEMTKEQDAAYHEIKKNLMLEIQSDMAGDTPKQLIINSILTKLLRLAQVTSGFLTFDAQHTDEGELISPKEIVPFDPNPKLDELIQLLKETGPKEKVLVWACWVQDIKTIAARLAEENMQHVLFYGAVSDEAREIALHDFAYDRECRIFAGNPAAGGAGLNLLGYPPGLEDEYETNTTHEIYFSQNWSYIARAQSEARPHRRGTRVQVRVTDLCVPQTIDEEIRARVIQKKIVAYEISDLSAILKSVLQGVA